MGTDDETFRQAGEAASWELVEFNDVSHLDHADVEATGQPGDPDVER